MSRKLTILIVIAALGLQAGSAAAFFENTMVSPRARPLGIMVTLCKGSVSSIISCTSA